MSFHQKSDQNHEQDQDSDHHKFKNQDRDQELGKDHDHDWDQKHIELYDFFMIVFMSFHQIDQQLIVVKTQYSDQYKSQVHDNDSKL